MRRPLGVLLLACALVSACGPVTTVLPQDVFDADGVNVRVPPPPGFTRLARGEGRARGAAYTTAAVFGVRETSGREPDARAFLLLPSRLGHDAAKHHERFRLIRDSWIARDGQKPSALEAEGRLRLAAFDRGHTDSAMWSPAGETRTLALGVPLATDEAVVQLTADMPDSPAEGLRWKAEAFVLVHGRVLQLECSSPPGRTLDALAGGRATMLAWVASVRAAAKSPTWARRRFRRG